MNYEKHYYLFANEIYDIKPNSSKIYKMVIKLNQNIKWLAFGLCDKKKVEENNFQFVPSKRLYEERNNGSYILNINCKIWNTNNHSECKKLKNLENKNLGEAGKVIEFHFIPNKELLQYYTDKELLASLTNIKLFKSEVFTPCIIFLQNCSIEVSFDYPDI